MARSFGWLAPAALTLLLSGCVTESTGYVAQKPIDAEIVNSTGKTIARVNYQSCDAPDGWRELAIGPLPSGNMTKFQLPEPCVNLQAFYADGKTAGSQTGVKREYPFRWVLS